MGDFFTVQTLAILICGEHMNFNRKYPYPFLLKKLTAVFFLWFYAIRLLLIGLKI